MTRFPTLAAAAALLYGAAALLAIPAPAVDPDETLRAELSALATGEMEKLVVHDEPYEPIEAGWVDGTGAERSVEDFRGKVVVVNYWATWCPPCVAEMPSLDGLAGAMAGENVAVVPISTDRGSADRIVDFYREIGIEHLEVHHDRSRKVAREAGLLGLPVTTILGPDGREVARLVGDAAWDSPEALALIRRLVELTASSRETRAGHAQAS